MKRLPGERLVSCAVEGLVDEVVVHRIASTVGGRVELVYGKLGKPYLDRKIAGYNQAARYSPWLVIRDMDHDEDCPVVLRDILLPDPEPDMCFRIVVRAVEAWLLADKENIAKFLGISVSVVPDNPESLDDPRRALINLARRSRRTRIRDDMVPIPGGGRSVGPGYAARMIEFVERSWRPDIAAVSAESLEKCIRCWQKLIQEMPSETVRL